MPYIDFTEIKANYTITDAADRLGLELRFKNKQWRGACPTCKSGGDRGLVLTPDKNAYFCFAEGKGGDVIALVAHIRGCDVKEAAQFLVGNTVPEERKKEASPSEGFKALDYLESDHEAVEAVGFAAGDAERIGVGYAKRGVGRGSVMIPVRLSCGTLVGYVGCQELTFVPSEWRFPT